MIRRLFIPAVLVAIAAPSASAQGFGSPVSGSDTRTISALVGPEVSSVPATESFTGRERWRLELQNQSVPLLTGAQIVVNSGYDLTDSSLFRFVAMLDSFVPGPPGPPTTFPCSVSSTEADCPAGPSTVALTPGSILVVDANERPGPPSPPTPPWLAPGVPKEMTPGFESAVSESAFTGGTASLHVLVTLRDAARYANSFELQVKIDGNAVPGSETVTSSSGPVPACPPGPPVTTCFRVNYGPPLCNDSAQGDGSANFFLVLAHLNETYDFGSEQTATPTCLNPPARPHVTVTAQQGGGSCPGGPACSTGPTTSITIPDADLQGSVTYRVNEPTEMQGAEQTRWAIDYLPILSATGPPATLTLTPEEAANTVDETHCVTAAVRDAADTPVPGATVVFSVPTATTTHASPPGGSAVTDADGQASFCYSASLPGDDAIHAFADADTDGQQDAGEPFDDAAKTWQPPASTPACKVSNGGWIVADNGDPASFGGNARGPGDSSNVRGQQEYRDHGPAQALNVHALELTATACSADLTRAAIFGTATVNGFGSQVFRIDVIDQGTNDAYGITLSNGYASGRHQLGEGEVTIGG